jgi:hypothetical protein
LTIKKISYVLELEMRFLVLIFILIGCAEPPKPVPPPPPPQFIEHTVKYQGETLAAISEWYLGDLKRWKEIQAVNPGLKPERIKIGDKIKIPSDKAVRRDPFPKPKVSKKAPAPKDEVKPEDKAKGKATEEKSAEEPKAEQVEQSSKVAQEGGEGPAPVADEDREKLREKTRLELLQDVLNESN